MADFWIKVEKSTPDKPEIFEMAEILDIDPDAVLGKLIRVWSWMDSNSEDGHIKSVTPVLINRLAGHTLFADAMRTVNWMADDCIPNFDRHLGESAKKRAKDAERKRKSRTSSAKSHTETVTEKGLDKSRVDKSKYKYSGEHLKVAEYIYSRVLSIAPNTKKPNIESWANSVRLMNEADSIHIDRICSVFNWANKDAFWATNILSVSKFREKYSVLDAKMRAPKQTGGYVTSQQQAANMAASTRRLETPQDLEF